MVYNYAVFSNFDFLEPNMFDAVASYLKANKEIYSGIVLNGNFSGESYVDFAKSDLDIRLEQSKFNESLRVKKKFEPTVDNFELGVLNQQKKLLSGKKKIYRYQDYLESLVNIFSGVGLEVFVNPGANEIYDEFVDVLDYVSDKKSNVVDVSKNPIIQKRDHELVFLPGILHDEPYEPNNGFILSSGHKSGVYEDEFEGFKTSWSVFGVQSLPELVNCPERALLFSSMSPLFKTKNGVDSYTFLELQNDVEVSFFDGFNHYPEFFEKGELVDKFDAFLVANNGGKLKPVFENFGSDFLNFYLKSMGFNKLVLNVPTGLGKVHDWEENKISTGQYSRELICSPSLMDSLVGGRVKLKNDESYYSPLYFKSPSLVN